MNKNGLVTMELLDRKKLINRIAYDQAYKFWQAEWSIAICELGLEGLSVNISDKFLAADKILVLREERNIAALALINYLDFNLIAYKDLSYLKAMPEEAMAFIVNSGSKKIFVSTYNIVAKQYRRLDVGGVVLAVALPGAALALFDRQPEFDLCVGMPLLPSANHRTLARLGMKNMPGGRITIHNVEAQFMYVARGEVALGKYDEGIRSLFSSNRLIA